MSDAGEFRRHAGAAGALGSGEAGSFLDDIEELRREAEALQRSFDIPPKPGAQFRGQDGTGAVRVTVGGDGRVRDMEIDPSWRRSIGVDGLGAAVVEAVTNAGMRRLTAWGKKVAEKQIEQAPAAETRTERERGGAETAPQPPTLADSAEAQKAVQEMLSMLEGVERELDEFEQRVSRRMQKQMTARGPSNMVSVTVAAGGQVVGVEIQPRFLERTDDRAISQELRSAFDAAYARAGRLSLDALLGDGQLAKIHALGSDPAVLLRKLGLDTRQPRR